MARLVSEHIGQFFVGQDRLEYTEFGSGDRWVVLVHGQLMPRRMHQPLARAIAADGFHVVTLDLLGHGRSDRPLDPKEYSMTAFGDQVLALLDHLGADQAVIGGTSLGANVSLEVADAAPERVRGPAAGDAGARQRARSGPDRLRPADVPGPLRAGLGVGGARAEPRRTRGLVPFWAGIALDTLNQQPAAMAATMHGIFFGRIAPPSVRRKEMTAPALVVGHPRDPIHPAADAAMLAEEMPNARFVEARDLLEWRLHPRSAWTGRQPTSSAPAGPSQPAGAARARDDRTQTLGREATSRTTRRRTWWEGGLSAVGDPVQAEGDLELELTLGMLPVLADQGADPVQPLRHGVDVHRQRLARAGEVATGLEVGLQRAHQVGAAALVVVEKRTERGCPRSRARRAGRPARDRRSPARPGTHPAPTDPGNAVRSRSAPPRRGRRPGRPPSPRDRRHRRSPGAPGWRSARRRAHAPPRRDRHRPRPEAAPGPAAPRRRHRDRRARTRCGRAALAPRLRSAPSSTTT